jgi:hypothetical protein
MPLWNHFVISKDDCVFFLRVLSISRYILEKERRQHCICTAQIISNAGRIPPSWYNSLWWAWACSLPRLRGHAQLDTLHTVALICTNDQPDAESSTWQHTTLTRDRQPCLRQDSNPQSQQTSGRKITRRTNEELLQGAKVGTFIMEEGVDICSMHSFFFTFFNFLCAACYH